MLGFDEDLIVAQCTPQGKGALALLRITGTNARQCVDSFALLASGKKIKDVSSHTIHFGRIIDESGTVLDQVMFLVMDGPKTFTGQDTIEITCHNNPFLIEALIEQAIKKGVRLAQEGEFTKRAFLQKKIDLIQAEAIQELISAHTQMALKKSLAQLEGSFSHWIDALEKDLLKGIAWCEVSFEFLDEGVEFGADIRISLENILTKIAHLKEVFDAQQQIKHGIKIALIGSVNAGKSSLFNALLKQRRAIVTDIPGTTRDVIEAGLYQKGNYWTLVDTAGLRQTKDTIEQEGIKRSFEEAHKADVILLVFDGSRALTHHEEEIYQDIFKNYEKKIIFVQSKQDLATWEHHPFHTYCPLRVSITQKHTLEDLTEKIDAKISVLFTTLESPFLLNKRHYALLLTLEQKMLTLLGLLIEPIHYEIVSYHLHDALTTLSELTGKSIHEAALDLIFKEFCVGK
ncbi:tRNA uridine-5-carboxymethylaminomethyl(34) synthesis GTPase MnmE [Candidatus Dependentiae bacterium]|nr:tRNA uridine-5-carboxymethylaminomethyl(34) synthesis GTPase MnmE [Candidatus Dependentiae bacterium]